MANEEKNYEFMLVVDDWLREETIRNPKITVEQVSNALWLVDGAKHGKKIHQPAALLVASSRWKRQERPHLQTLGNPAVRLMKAMKNVGPDEFHRLYPDFWAAVFTRCPRMAKEGGWLYERD